MAAKNVSNWKKKPAWLALPIESPRKEKIDPKAANMPIKITNLSSLRWKLWKRSLRHNAIPAKYKSTIDVSTKATKRG